MLSKGASNALLKTLEDPPGHVVFVLATTDPQKVEKTISSRTQHLQFHLLPADVLTQHVEYIVKDAGLDLPPDALDYVLRAGGGSARDTLSALDQVVAAGSVPDDGPSVEDLVDALADRDAARALAGVAAAVSAGTDVRSLTERLVAWLRDTFLVAMAPDVVELAESARARAASQAERLGPAATVRALEVLGGALVEMRHATDPRVLLDVALVRIANPATDDSPGALLERLERLERAAATGAASAAAAPPPPTSGGRAALGSHAAQDSTRGGEAADRDAGDRDGASGTDDRRAATLSSAAGCASPHATSSRSPGPTSCSRNSRGWSRRSTPRDGSSPPTRAARCSRSPRLPTGRSAKNAATRSRRCWLRTSVDRFRSGSSSTARPRPAEARGGACCRRARRHERAHRRARRLRPPRSIGSPRRFRGRSSSPTNPERWPCPATTTSWGTC